MSADARPARPLLTAVVRRASRISPSMVRVCFGGADIEALDGDLFADSYVKLQFAGSPRAYTIRALADGEMTIDFVVHGDEGLAGPWAAAAQPGDEIAFVGPGGAWLPRSDADWHLFVGDESALPAIASGLERLGDAPSLVFVEIAGPGHEYPLPADVTWIHRGDAPYGERLVEALRGAEFPSGDAEGFVHGNADMVRPLRRHLLAERGFDRSTLSISGYWRAGLTDEAWRAGKREFNAAMEHDVP